jgi:integrase/recombinase XerD
MDVSDLAPDGRFKLIGKGSKVRVATVGGTGMIAIGEYLDSRHHESLALWTTPSGDRLTIYGLTSMLKRIEGADPLLSEGVYAHRFRHTAITRLLRDRVPLRSVQRYAGHSNPQTTLRYAQALDAEEAINVVSGKKFRA